MAPSPADATTSSSNPPGNLYDNTPWQTYNTYRPTYPPSLFHTILSHHQLANNTISATFHAAHDIGTGAAQCAANLASYFTQIYASDPSSHNISTARALLTSPFFQSSLPHHVNFHLAVQRGEEEPTADGFITPQSLDMVTCCAAMHWMTPSLAVSAAAKSLKAGGTMAVVYYAQRPRIEGDEEAEGMWLGLCRGFMRRVRREKVVVRRACETSCLGLDRVEFVCHKEAGDWRDVRRIYVNTGCDVGSLRRSFGYWVEQGEEYPESKRGKGDKVEEVSDESWSKTVDAGWFRGYLETMSPGEPLADEEVKMLEKLRDLLGERKIRVIWSVAIVLATKA